MSPPPKASKRTRDALKVIAIVAQTIPQRVQQFRITSTSTSRKVSCEYKERHKQIFPAGFDSTSSSNSAERLYYPFSPNDYTMSLRKNTAPKHEFIILEVEDTASPGLKNFIALDRNNGEGPNRPPRRTLSSDSQTFAAKDEFRVSYDGNRDRLLEQCGLQHHETLETLVFQSHEPLLLYQLATLTRAVSLQRDKYHVINANCYWFAGLIWDCIIRMRPSAYCNVLRGQIRGAFISWLRHSTNTAELVVTYEYVDKELLEIEKNFAIQKQRWTRSHDTEIKDDLEAMRKRVRELEEQLAREPLQIRLKRQRAYFFDIPARMQAIRGIATRRRSTVPQYHKHEPMHVPPRDTTPTKLPNHSQNPKLPPVSHRSLKRLRKYYIANLSSKHGSTHNQVITSGTYHASVDADFIRLETSENKEGKLGILILESPRPNKGPSMARLLRSISQSNAVQSIGNIVPIAPNLGYFSSIHREASESYHNLIPTPPSQSIIFQNPLPLDNLVVLAGRISSRRSHRSLGSKKRNWFIEAMWEGLKRLNAVHEGNTHLGPSSNCDNMNPRIPALVDEVMPTFGASLLHFHHKVLKAQQKRDHSMSVSQEQKNIVRQEIAERNQDIMQTQAGWDAVEREREELRRKESQLQQRLLVRGSTMN